jgi:ankyrin repeat protein
MKISEKINGRTLLHYAADAENEDILKELINNGANVNVNINISFNS